MPQLVGHCVNLMPLRSQIDRAARFPDFLRAVRVTLLDGNDRQHYAFGSLVRDLRVDREPSRIPITPVMFNINNRIDLSNMCFGRAATEFVSNPSHFENFEIFLNITNGPESLLAEWTYNSGLFDAETIKGHMAGLSVLLEKIVTAPDSLIAVLLAPTPDEAAALAAVARPQPTAFPAVRSFIS